MIKDLSVNVIYTYTPTNFNANIMCSDTDIDHIIGRDLEPI